MNGSNIVIQCEALKSATTRGKLGQAIAAIVLSYSPKDIQQMQWNFSGAIQDVNHDYRKRLEETISGHLQGTYQTLGLMKRQGNFSRMREPVPRDAKEYWTMVVTQCSSGDDEQVRLQFLKFLLSGFCMLVQELPGHPAGMPFPGGDKVEVIDGTAYCPVREKANDVDSAHCPFCPALQTPEIGYLRPPVNASEYRKQEFIRQTYDRHHFNG